MPPRSPWRSRGRRALGAAAVLGVLAIAGCGGEEPNPLADIAALQDAGRFAESIEPLRAQLDRDPDLAEAHYRLGVALSRTGQRNLAVWPLEKAIETPGLVVPAGLLLADTFVGLGAYGDAIRVANLVLAADPSQLGALRARSQALLGDHRRKEALVDAQRVYDAVPDDFQAGLMVATILAELGRVEEAETVHARIETSAQTGTDPTLVVRACLARASFFEEHLTDDALAEARYRTCLALAPADPLALQLATSFLDQRGRSTESLAFWERALAEAPENLAILQGLALRYERFGESDRALALLTDRAAESGSPDAWMLLAEFERRQGRLGEALHAVEQAEDASSAPSERVLFTKTELLIDDGQIDAAEQSIEAFDDESVRALLEGRVLLARGDARAALAAFDRGLQHWPDNAGARYLAGRAAREIGDTERAISEFREAVRADPRATDAALELAALELGRGQPQDAAAAASSFLEHRSRTRAEAYRLLLRALRAQDLLEPARRTAQQFADAGFVAESALARAELEAAAHGPAAGARAIETSGVDVSDPVHEPVLRALIQFQVDANRTIAALTAVDRALAVEPDTASLHELRGAVLLHLARADDAQKAFQAALALDAGNARARSGLAQIALAQGDAKRAIALYDEAAKASGDDVGPVYAAAQVALASGDPGGARRRLEDVIRRDPDHAGARNDLAWMLAQSAEDLERALELATRAHEIDPDPDITDTLGYVHLQRGESAQAIERFEQALAERPHSQSMRYHLGLALARSGDRERAIATLRKALEGGPFPETEAAQRELAQLEDQPAEQRTP